MNEKDIEKKLEESVNRAFDKELSDFSVRLKQINTELKSPRNDFVIEKQKTVATSNANVKILAQRKTIVISLILLAVVICGIVLPIIFNQSILSPTVSYFETELYEETVDKEGFEKAMKENNIKVIDYSNFHVNKYFLSKSQKDKRTYGGKVELTLSEEPTTFAKISVYDSTYISINPNFYENFILEHKVNNIKISYGLIESKIDEKYKYVYNAVAKYDNVHYKIELYLINDSIIEFLNSFFE